MTLASLTLTSWPISLQNKPTQHWCSSEPPGITLRDMKHSFPIGNRVLSLLVLESAAPRKLAGGGFEDEETEDSYERFMGKR